MKKIVLIGFAATYKSSVGKLLSEKLNLPHVDTDDVLQTNARQTIQQIFDTHGEQAFRRAENDLIGQLCTQDNVVISCGGGSVLASNFTELAQNAVVVWLTATAQTIKSRLGTPARPLFDGLTESQLQQYVDSRTLHYQQYANVCLPTDGLSSTQVAQQLYELIIDV